MLLLSRRQDKRVCIRLPDGSEIWVLVVRVRGDWVRLGFTAPEGVEIWREEIVKARKRAQDAPSVPPAV